MYIVKPNPAHQGEVGPRLVDDGTFPYWRGEGWVEWEPDDAPGGEPLPDYLTAEALGASFVPASLSRQMVAWRAILATRSTTRVGVLCVGDSRTEGSGPLPRIENRWQTRLQAALRSRLGEAGGATIPFIPAYPQTNTPMPVTRAGTVTQDTSWGIGWRTARITSTPGSVTFTFTGTSCQVMYARHSTGTGVLSITIDGGAPVTVNTGGTSSHGATWTSPALTRGVHTVVVARDASSPAGTYVAVQGLLAYDGDETAGLRFLDSGYAGASSNFLTASRLGFLPPALVAAGHTLGLAIVALGTNDADVFNTVPDTYRANLLRLITTLRAAPVNFTGDVLLLNLAKPSGITDAEYRTYEDVMAALAAADDRVHYLDLRTRMPDVPVPPTDPAGLGLFIDDTHENSAGHQWIADVLAEQLAPGS